MKKRRSTKEPAPAAGDIFRRVLNAKRYGRVRKIIADRAGARSLHYFFIAVIFVVICAATSFSI